MSKYMMIIEIDEKTFREPLSSAHELIQVAQRIDGKECMCCFCRAVKDAPQEIREDAQKKSSPQCKTKTDDVDVELLEKKTSKKTTTRKTSKTKDKTS